MGKRLAPVLAVLVMLMPAAGYALGLGNMVMNSALNQPLDAEIELLSVQSGDLDNLSIRLGATEDFDRVGVIREFFYTEFKFDVAKRPNGDSYIKVTSTKPIIEPFLDFVVEARWARGRILREFTVLVDPPALSEEAPAPIQQAATAAPAMAPAQTMAPARMAAAPQASQQTRPAPIRERADLTPVMKTDGELSYGPVKYKDTLYEIANKMRPAGVTANQMMLALARNNPQAFYNGNINQLKAGFVLRIEDANQLAALSESEANAEVDRQRIEWEARKSGKLVRQTGEAASGGRVARGDAPGGARSAAEQARLKLVAPGSEGAGSGAGSEEVGRLRQDLLLAAEALDANKQETDELKSRLAEMEEQLESMQRLIMLKDDEMLALQKQMGKEVPAKATPEMAMSEIAEVPEEGMADAEKPATEAPAEMPKAARPVPAPMPRPEPGLLDDPMVMYGGIGLAVLLVAGFLVYRRRKMQDGFEESILNVGDGHTGEMGATAETMEGNESSMVSDFAMSEMSGMSGIHSDAADVDPVSEADVYLAYGRHQQAEDILKEALAKEPDRHEIKLKLLEVYFAAKNREAFEQGAQELHDAIGNEDDPIWAKTVTMGSQLCPNSELFGGTSTESLKEELAGDVASSEEDLLDFDFDLDSDDIDTSGSMASGDADVDDVFAELEAATSTAKEPVTETVESTEADTSLDFDMDFDVATPAVEEKAPEKPADNSLDFDVSSLDFNLDEEGADIKPAEVEAGAATEDTGALDFDGMDFGGESETVEATSEAASEAMADTDLDDVLGGELEDAFSEVDEVGTKLDLAKAYVDMGDNDGARSILDEVMEEGDDGQKAQAQELLGQLG